MMSRVLLWIALCATVVNSAFGQPFFARRAGSAQKNEDVIESYRMSQRLVERRWKTSWTEDLPCALPKLHGHVVKMGSGTRNPTLFTTPTKSTSFVSKGIPIYTGCHVFVSRKFKFIYLRQPKSSSTSLLRAIRTQMCSTRACTEDEFSKVSAGRVTEDMWREYFVFTFVRNPWTRMLSAYNMFIRTFLKSRGHDGQPLEHCSTPFLDFSANSNTLRTICDTDDCCPYLDALSRFVPHFVDIHINDQSHCAFLPGGEILVDFVGASETIDEDWPQVVAAINARSGMNVSAGEVLNTNGHGSAENGGVLTSCMENKVRERFNETTLFNIAKQYSMDMVRYGYL